MPNDCCADGDSEIRPHLPMILLSLSLVLNVIYFYHIIYASDTRGGSVAGGATIAISSMGLTFSSLYNWFVGGGEYKVVMVGLDNAGKTSILYRL